MVPHDRGGHDRGVDPEDRAPTETVDQHAAEDRTERQRQARHRADHPDGPCPLGRVRERRGDDRQRDRVEHRAADCLRCPRGDQPADTRCQAAQHRAEPEHGETDLKDAPTANPVGGGSGQHEESRQHQRVRVDRPLQAGHRGIQVTADRRQRNGDDGDVHHHDHDAGAADREHEESAAPAGSPVVPVAGIEALMITTLGIRARSKSSRRAYAISRSAAHERAQLIELDRTDQRVCVPMHQQPVGAVAPVDMGHPQ